MARWRRLFAGRSAFAELRCRLSRRRRPVGSGLWNSEVFAFGPVPRSTGHSFTGRSFTGHSSTGHSSTGSVQLDRGRTQRPEPRLCVVPLTPRARPVSGLPHGGADVSPAPMARVFQPLVTALSGHGALRSGRPNVYSGVERGYSGVGTGQSGVGTGAIPPHPIASPSTPALGRLLRSTWGTTGDATPIVAGAKAGRERLLGAPDRSPGSLRWPEEVLAHATGGLARALDLPLHAGGGPGTRRAPVRDADPGVPGPGVPGSGLSQLGVPGPSLNRFPADPGMRTVSSPAALGAGVMAAGSEPPMPARVRVRSVRVRSVREPPMRAGVRVQSVRVRSVRVRSCRATFYQSERLGRSLPPASPRRGWRATLSAVLVTARLRPLLSRARCGVPRVGGCPRRPGRWLVSNCRPRLCWSRPRWCGARARGSLHRLARAGCHQCPPRSGRGVARRAPPTSC